MKPKQQEDIKSNITDTVVLKSFAGKLSRQQLLIFLIWFFFSTLIVAVPFFSQKVNLKSGEIAPYTLLSPVNIELETTSDKIATDILKEERSKLVENVYDIDNGITEKVKIRLSNFFKKIIELKSISADDNRRASIKKNLEYKISPTNLQLLLNTDDNVLSVMETLLLQTLDIIMNEGVEDSQSLDVKLKINNAVSEMLLDVRFKQVIKDILTQAIENNKILNLVTTNLKRAQAISSVVPVKTRFVKNQPIFYKGDKITEDHIEILKKLGMYGSVFNLPIFLAVAMINFLALFFLAGYLFKYQTAVLNNQRLLTLVVMISLSVLVLARFLVGEPLYLPIVFAALIYAVLLKDFPLAFLLMLHLTVLVTLIFNQEFYYFLVFLITSLYAVYFSRQINERNDITKAGFYTALCSVLILLAVSVASGKFALTSVLINSAKLFGVSLVSAILVLGLLPYLEDFFKVVTSIKLLELANPNAPLLKRLLIEAPGTYHHSIMVANLAEAAIEATNGDPLLARVAGYYHDIGKIKRPYFFIENQTGLENPHDKLKVSMSVMIIMAHVKDGVELAKQYKLPPVLIDTIREHHGTNLISYFYHNFMEKINQVDPEDGKVLTESDFRYPGPKPRSKEAAAVMIADAVEAAIRSLEKASASKIEHTVDKILKEKFESGQLDDCAFTLRDLTLIKQAFLKRLEGLYHTRLQYPLEENKDKKTEQE